MRRFTLGIMAVACFFALSGCDYEVPLTAKPTRKVDEKLLGDWIPKDGKEKMKVRRFDDTIYIVSYDGNLYRAFHSDVAKTSFVSVQDIDSPDRKYAYLTWMLSDDGKRLGLRVVNNKIIPNENKDSETIQKLIEKNLQSPELLGEETQFNKEK
ncbi:MAG: hypothetical protein ABI651_09955 [Verrucomicrobiota bacterium]